MSTHDQILSWTDQGDTRLQAAKASDDAPLQLTHMVLGNAATPIPAPAIKQASQVRSEVYRAPVDRVTVDTARKRVVCELLVPENQKNQTIHEIGIFEHETLVAIGHASSGSGYTLVQQEDGAWTCIVHIPLGNIPASAIEIVDNLISLEVSDTRYLDAAENLKDLTDNPIARSNLGLGSAATKNAGTGNADLIATSDADRRYLNATENLSDLADKARARTNLGLGTAALKNHGTGNADLITTSDADSRYLNATENLRDLADKDRARTNLGLGTAALKNHGTGNADLITTGDADSRYLNATENLRDLADKDRARTNLGLGTAARKNYGTGNADLITTGDADSRYLRASENQFSTFTKATLNAEALYQIVKSESVCQTLETQLQSHRSTVHNILNAAPSSLFTKQSGVTVGDGRGSWELGKNTATIYIPTACNDDNDTDYTVSSLLSGNQLVSIAKHSGATSVTTGIALRGARVSGVGSSVGNVVFDVFTAVNNAAVTTPLTDNILKNIFSENYGYQKFLGGLIMQWLHLGSISHDLKFTWPMTFPTACLSANGTFSDRCSSHWQHLGIGNLTKQGATIYYEATSGHSGSNSVYIWAIGH